MGKKEKKDKDRYWKYRGRPRLSATASLLVYVKTETAAVKKKTPRYPRRISFEKKKKIYSAK
jgi:hypothetical protein